MLLCSGFELEKINFYICCIFMQKSIIAHVKKEPDAKLCMLIPASGSRSLVNIRFFRIGLVRYRKPGTLYREPPITSSETFEEPHSADSRGVGFSACAGSSENSTCRCLPQEEYRGLNNNKENECLRIL